MNIHCPRCGEIMSSADTYTHMSQCQCGVIIGDTLLYEITNCVRSVSFPTAYARKEGCVAHPDDPLGCPVRWSDDKYAEVMRKRLNAVGIDTFINEPCSRPSVKVRVVRAWVEEQEANQ